MNSPKLATKQNFNGSIYVRTPLIESVPLQKHCGGRKVYLKMDNLQPSGSFKLRGIANLCKYVSDCQFNAFSTEIFRTSICRLYRMDTLR